MAWKLRVGSLRPLKVWYEDDCRVWGLRNDPTLIVHTYKKVFWKDCTTACLNYTRVKTFSHLFVSGFKISLNSNILISLVFGLFRIAAKKVRFLGDLEPICVFSPHPHGCNMLFIFRSLQKWRYKSIEKHPITKRIMRRNWAGWRWMNCQEIFFFHQSFWNPSLFSVYQNWYPDDWLVDMTWLFSVNF